MYKYLKLIYICFSMVILSFSLVLSITLNKNIFLQKEIIDKNEKELSYIIELNDKIDLTNYNLQELRLKNGQINDLNIQRESLVKKENELQNSINNYNQLNNQLREKINYYK